MIRKGLIAAVLALVAAAAPAQARQTAPAAELKGPAVGATVYGPSGAEAGKIEKIDGQIVVLSTGTNRLRIPLDRFGKGPKGPTIMVERAQLDAMADAGKAEARAALQAKLVPGAEVRGSGGAVLGSVKAVEGDMVTLAASKGEVRVPVAGFAANDQGLVLNMTAEAFEAAVAASH